jgi:multiple sugar transport system permease protein
MAQAVAVTSPELHGPGRGRPAARRTVNRGRLLEAIGRHALLIVVLIIFLAPLVFVVGTSLMSTDQVLTTAIIPRPFRWANFHDVFQAAPLVRYFLNTLLIAGLSTIGTVVSSVPVAYALARFRFRGRNALFVVFIAAMVLPPQVTVVPLYVMFAHLHWTGTPAPLIVPSFLGDAYSIFLLRQFFLTVPQDLLDAGRIDGAGEFKLLLRVFLPLVRPAIAAVALFSFFYAWNDFFNPLLYLGSNPNWSTLSIALASFRTAHSVEWNLTMAATMVFVIPVVVVFFFAQKAFVQGVTLTGVKG